MKTDQPTWIAALRAEGYSIGQDRAGFYHWITQHHTSPRKLATEDDAWHAARCYRNDTRPDKSEPKL